MSALTTISRIPAFIAGLFGHKSVDASIESYLAGREEGQRATLKRVRDKLIAMSNRYDELHGECAEDSYVTRSEYAADCRRYFRFAKAVDDVLAGRAEIVNWSVRVEYVAEWEAEERAEYAHSGEEWEPEHERERSAHESIVYLLAADIEAMRNYGVCVDTSFEAVSIEAPEPWSEGWEQGWEPEEE